MQLGGNVLVQARKSLQALGPLIMKKGIKT